VAMNNSIPEAAARASKAFEAELPRIHMFWHGEGLSRVERLAMSSFLAHGHAVALHVYQEPRGVPGGVELLDASLVVPATLLFRHRETGSYAVFADWFRYCVLLQFGGIWADTDCVCLRPLRYPTAEIYAWEDDRKINNAVLGLPVGHELAAWMADCCARPNRFLPYDNWKTKWRKLRRRLRAGNGRDLVKWGETGPEGFTAAARYLGYAERALPSWHFYPIHYRDWRIVFESNQPGLAARLSGSTALHLWNEMMRREPGFDLNARFPTDSLFERLWAQYLKNDT
jgi:hypothetical protein